MKQAKKIPLEKNQTPAIDILIQPLINCGLYNEASKIKPGNEEEIQYGKTIHMLIAVDYAKNGDFNNAMETLKRLECLNEPFNAYGKIAQFMVEYKQYDQAFELIEYVHKNYEQLLCKQLGDRWGPLEDLFSDFPDKFAEDGRFDLAMKSLKYVDHLEIVKALVSIEIRMRKQGYKITEKDKRFIRELIHSDKAYIER
jgi:tetratricopeptide (TPR) repeat protein